MPASLVAACPLCGLRFTNRALLELHLREDHPRPQPKDGRNGLARAAEAAAPPAPADPAPGGRGRSADQARSGGINVTRDVIGGASRHGRCHLSLAGGDDSRGLSC